MANSKRKILGLSIFFAFLIFASVPSAWAADLSLTGGGTSITYPTERWLRDFVTVTNASDNYKEFAYYIYYPQTSQEFAGFPQPSFLYLSAGESQNIYFFMDELWGKLKDLSLGVHQIPVEISIGLKANQLPDRTIKDSQKITITETVKVVAGGFKSSGQLAQEISSATNFILKKFIITEDWGIYRANLSPDEQYLVTSPGYCQVPENKDLYLRLFDINSNQEILKYKLPGQSWGVSVAQNANYIAFGSDNSEVTVIDKNGVKIFSQTLTSKEVRLTKNGDLLAIGTQFGDLYLYEIPSGNLRWKTFVRGQVRALRFYKNETKLLAGSGDGNLYQFDVKSGQRDWRADVETWPFQHIGISPDEKLISVGGKADPATLVTDTGVVKLKKYVGGAVHWTDIFSDYSAIFDGGYYDKNGNQKWLLGGLGNITGVIFQDKYIIAGGDGVSVTNRDGQILWKWMTQQPDGVQRMVRFAKITADGKKIIASGHKTNDCSTGFVAIFEGEIKPALQTTKPISPKPISPPAGSLSTPPSSGLNQSSQPPQPYPVLPPSSGRPAPQPNFLPQPTQPSSPNQQSPQPPPISPQKSTTPSSSQVKNQAAVKKTQKQSLFKRLIQNISNFFQSLFRK